MRPILLILVFLLFSSPGAPAFWPEGAAWAAQPSGSDRLLQDSPKAWQEAFVLDLEVGKHYEGQTRIRVPLFGVSFLVPPDWQGGVPQGSEVFLLGSDTTAGVGLVLFLVNVTSETMAAKLEEPQVLGEHLRFQPAGPVQRTDNRSLASYISAEHVGRAVALAGPSGQGIIYFFAGPRTESGTFERLLERLAASTRFLPVETAGAERQWRDFLNGMMLKQLASYSSGDAGGYGLTTAWHLCPDGRFSSFRSSSVSVDVPGASGFGGEQDRRTGEWRVEVTGMVAVLILTDSEETQTRHRLDYDGTKTFLDGERVFRVRSDQCS